MIADEAVATHWLGSLISYSNTISPKYSGLWKSGEGVAIGDQLT